jgi:hypothetical protein
LLVTSDLHFDHGRSGHLALEAAREISELGRRGEFDALLVVGDTATSAGENLERGLERLEFEGPRLMTLGNHELWSREGVDTLELYERTLPERVRRVGWRLLDETPVWLGDVAVVGNVGWYDYSFIPEYLGIPRRFYEAKISPGSAAYYTAYSHLLSPSEDVPAAAMEVFARWNDGKFVRWPEGFSDVAFTRRLLEKLRSDLESARSARTVVVALHHLPREELLPPRSTPAWDFAKTYLGSPVFGRVIEEYANVSHVISGHSHFASEYTHVGTRYRTTGSGYREKKWEIVEL